MSARTITLDAENGCEPMPPIKLPPMTDEQRNDLSGIFEDIAPGNRAYKSRVSEDSPLDPFLTELWLQLEAHRLRRPLSIVRADHELSDAIEDLHYGMTQSEPQIEYVYGEMLKGRQEYDPERVAAAREQIRELFAKLEAACDRMDAELAALYDEKGSGLSA